MQRGDEPRASWIDERQRCDKNSRARSILSFAMAVESRKAWTPRLRTATSGYTAGSRLRVAAVFMLTDGSDHARHIDLTRARTRVHITDAHPVHARVASLSIAHKRAGAHARVVWSDLPPTAASMIRKKSALLGESCRRDVPDAAVRPPLVVVALPVGDGLSGLPLGLEPGFVGTRARLRWGLRFRVPVRWPSVLTQ